MSKVFSRGLVLMAFALFATTVISLIHSDLWWIQALSFPRMLFLIAIVVMAIVCWFSTRHSWRLIALALLGVAALLQAWRLYPYTWFAPTEVARLEADDRSHARSCFTLLGLNVLQHNDDYAKTRELIDREQPDILLLMETNGDWARELASVLARYPVRIMRPLGNTYGLVFATKLPVRSVETKNITDRDTPTVYATLETRDGQPFDYIGLHPRPPRPGQDTTLRDRKIERAALAIAHHELPAIAMGDFNDIPWSRTTQLFKHVGGYLDPRIGRGSYPTFPADLSTVAWPLDQLFVSPGFMFSRLEVLEKVGSDHRPLAARLCLSGKPARQRNGSPDDLDRAALKAARSVADSPSSRPD